MDAVEERLYNSIKGALIMSLETDHWSPKAVSADTNHCILLLLYLHYLPILKTLYI